MEEFLGFLNDKRNRTYISLFAIIIAIIGIVSCIIQKNAEGIGIFIFGILFFFGGLMISLLFKYFGIIFLLSHAMLGFLAILKAVLGNITSEAFLSDVNNDTLIFCLYVIGVFAIIAFLLMIIYNLSDKFKKKKFGLLLPLSFYTISILIASILPIIYK